MEFSSVGVVGNMVKLFGGSGITVQGNLFADNINIISVVDNNSSIIYLAFNAFLRSINIAYVSFPVLITAESACFSNCTNLASCLLPMLQTAGDGLFQECGSLTTVDLTSLESLPNSCFLSCSSLSVIDLPTVSIVGDMALYATILTSINLPLVIALGSTVTDNFGFGDSVFFGITGQTITLTIPAALMTCNGGAPDGDIQYLQANNTVTVITV
jgi:hypothetical protein